MPTRSCIFSHNFSDKTRRKMSESDPYKSQKDVNCCISHKFVDAASRDPDKIAVIHASSWAARILSDSETAEPSESPSCTLPVYNGDKCFTFADLSSSFDSLSSRLRRIIDVSSHTDPYLIRPQFKEKLDCKAVPESDVYMPKMLALYMPPSVEYIISVLSVLRCGESFLPLDPSWPRERVLSVISSSNVTLVIASCSSFDQFGCKPLKRSHWLLENIACPVLFFSMNERLSVETGSSSFVWPCKKERQRQFCYLMYTSGSTGKPKGVCGTEQGLLNRFLWMQEIFPVVGEEQFAFKTSVGFIDHLQEFLGAILNSTPLVIPPFEHLKDNMFSIIDFLEAKPLMKKNKIKELIDPSLAGDHEWRQIKLVLLAASLSIQQSSIERPEMNQVVEILKGNLNDLKCIMKCRVPFYRKAFRDEIGKRD